MSHAMRALMWVLAACGFVVWGFCADSPLFLLFYPCLLMMAAECGWATYEGRH